MRALNNSLEERAPIHGVSGNQSVPGVVVGIDRIPNSPRRRASGRSSTSATASPSTVGRIDENKGCGELFDFTHYSSALADGLHLVLIGKAVIPVPEHPRIHHLGFVTDEDKFDAIAASELLIMPSYFESLSMVALEAWALGRPVLANAACDVLQGQCLRSNAGLFYDGFAEFFETLRTLDGHAALAAALGQNGREYYRRHYSWPVIERKTPTCWIACGASRRRRPWSRCRAGGPAGDGCRRPATMSSAGSPEAPPGPATETARARPAGTSTG